MFPLHAVYPDPDHRDHHHEDYHAGPDLLQAETERIERQGVLLLQVPEHEGECGCGQGAGYEG